MEPATYPKQAPAYFFMPPTTKHLASNALRVSLAITLSSCVVPAFADDAVKESTNTEETELTVEVGALSFIGTDLWLSYRKHDSHFQYGLRYLNIQDDFIDESAAGLPNSSSDTIYTRRAGVHMSYLFRSWGYQSFYVGGAVYDTKTELKCGSITTPGAYESDAASTPGLYFSGGFQGRWSNGFGYNIGILLSPFVNNSLKAGGCSHESSGDFDVRATLSYTFR